VLVPYDIEQRTSQEAVILLATLTSVDPMRIDDTSFIVSIGSQVTMLCKAQ